MGKTLEECYEVLGLENGASEGNLCEKCDDSMAGFCVSTAAMQECSHFSLSFTKLSIKHEYGTVLGFLLFLRNFFKFIK